MLLNNGYTRVAPSHSVLPSSRTSESKCSQERRISWAVAAHTDRHLGLPGLCLIFLKSWSVSGSRDVVSFLYHPHQSFEESSLLNTNGLDWSNYDMANLMPKDKILISSLAA